MQKISIIHTRCDGIIWNNVIDSNQLTTLQAFSKMPEQDQDASKLDKAQVEIKMVIPPGTMRRKL